jgi:transposase
MLFVNPLSKEEITSLQEMMRNHPLSWTRIRANAIILSSEGILLQKIARLCGVNRQAISIWLKNWDSKGLCGLVDKPRQGRPKKLSSLQEKEVIEIVKKFPRSLNQALAEIERLWGIKLSKSTLKKQCKKAGLSWKRVRKSLRGKRNDDAFYAALDEIKNIINQCDIDGEDFYYCDESGFSLEPCVPYAWQDVGQQIEIPSSKSNRLNVLGFINHVGHFEGHVFEGSINTEVVVACFDDFAKKISKRTVVLIDNASIHTSNLFKDNIDKWEKENLIIYNIPPYSPELNKIEILWRKIKYEWLDFSAYESFKSLKNSLNNILANIGQKYHINFT